MNYWEMIHRDLRAAGFDVEFFEVPAGWRVVCRGAGLVWVAEAEELLTAFMEVEAGVRSVAVV